MADQKEPTQEEKDALAKIRNVGPSSYAQMQAENFAKQRGIAPEAKAEVPVEPEPEVFDAPKEEAVVSETEKTPEPASDELFPVE